MIKDFGQYVMAESLRKQKVILPYGMASKFTAKLESKVQAHKIFERQALEKVLNLKGKALDEAVEKAPAIILTKERHAAISEALAQAWKAQKAKVEGELTKKELREIYKEVYKKEPHWLEAIESYLR